MKDWNICGLVSTEAGWYFELEYLSELEQLERGSGYLCDDCAGCLGTETVGNCSMNRNSQ